MKTLKDKQIFLNDLWNYIVGECEKAYLKENEVKIGKNETAIYCVVDTTSSIQIEFVVYHNYYRDDMCSLTFEFYGDGLSVWNGEECFDSHFDLLQMKYFFEEKFSHINNLRYKNPKFTNKIIKL